MKNGRVLAVQEMKGGTEYLRIDCGWCGFPNRKGDTYYKIEIQIQKDTLEEPTRPPHSIWVQYCPVCLPRGAARLRNRYSVRGYSKSLDLHIVRANRILRSQKAKTKYMRWALAPDSVRAELREEERREHEHTRKLAKLERELLG